LNKDLKWVDELWSEGLRKWGGPFLAGGEFTAVDAFFAPVVLRLQTYVGVLEGVGMGDGVRGYVKVMLEVDGVKDWVADALRETDREDVHDRDTIERPGRRLVEDLRAT
jgi:glutathione S-transferase